MSWLGALALHDGVAVQEIVPESRGDAWQCTCEAWRRLPPHRSILSPVERGDGRMWVRFVELQLARPRDERDVATWLVELVDVYWHIVNIRAPATGELACPLASA